MSNHYVYTSYKAVCQLYLKKTWKRKRNSQIKWLMFLVGVPSLNTFLEFTTTHGQSSQSEAFLLEQDWSCDGCLRSPCPEYLVYGPAPTHIGNTHLFPFRMFIIVTLVNKQGSANRQRTFSPSSLTGINKLQIQELYGRWSYWECRSLSLKVLSCICYVAGRRNADFDIDAGKI